MSGSELRAGWLRLQVLLLLAPALLVGTPPTSVLAVGVLALVAAALITSRTAVPAPAGPGTTGLRAWVRTEQAITRAEQPDRPGRPRPRAPGVAAVASGR